MPCVLTFEDPSVVVSVADAPGRRLEGAASQGRSTFRLELLADPVEADTGA
jgi:hypothetical protein